FGVSAQLYMGMALLHTHTHQAKCLKKTGVDVSDARVGIFTTRYHQTNELFGSRLGANGCSAACCSALLNSQSIIEAKSRRPSQSLVHVIVYRLYH
ncbi:hypothetical protein JI435_411950, partial [Parastagonospora nodorum SN15]